MQYLTDYAAGVERGCILSDCGAYRYRLWRDWDKRRPTIAFMMLNPSTANHLTDDPTIARCMSRAVAGGFGRLEVTNLFPLRATHPDALLTRPDPLGRNAGEMSADDAIMETVEGALMIICGWGAHPAAAARAPDVMRLLQSAGIRERLYCLGINRNGSPKHPLYVAAGEQPRRYVMDDECTTTQAMLCRLFQVGDDPMQYIATQNGPAARRSVSA